MNKDLKPLADEYDEKDWSFSSAETWKKIVHTNPHPINKIQYAEQLRLSGNLNKALATMESIDLTEISDKHKFAFYFRKGMIHKDRGELTLEIECFRKSIEFENDQTFPYIFLATALSKGNELDEIQTILTTALKKEGAIDEVNYNLSLNYARKDNFTKAISCMKNCLRIDPDYPNAKTWLNDFQNMIKNQSKNLK